MGFLSFFKRKEADSGSSEGSDKEIGPLKRMPTVKPEAGLFSAYNEIFLKEMAILKGFSKGDIEAMHQIITKGEGGHLNQGRYYKVIFDEFFKNREWVWPEFEKWEEIFVGLGEYPTKWGNYRRPIEEVEPSEIVQMLKVSELKDLLSSAGINYPINAKKTGLIEAVLVSPAASQAVTNSALWPDIRAKFFSPRYYGLYQLLMRTIQFRAMSLYDRRRQTQLGITKRKIRVVFDADQKFIDMALTENPDALTPLFPGDLSMWKAEVPGFE